MQFKLRLLSISFTLFSYINTIAQQDSSKTFKWPNGKKAAISLSFDDGRESQVTGGTALLDQYNVKATFYVVPSAVEKQLDGWKKAVASGHEIGNHSFTHPCTGNFTWSRGNALEDYDLKRMKKELDDCNSKIYSLLKVRPTVFAYPCGQKFVGRGVNTKSYVPLVASAFISGRGWKDEAANDPVHCNFAQLTGVEMDGKDFSEILPLIEAAVKNGQWLLLAGHEMNEKGDQTTRFSMLKELAEYVNDPANGIWIAPVGEVTKYLQQKKK